MLPLPNPLLRIPRCLMEHPLPQSGPGISAELTYQAADGSLFTLTLGLVDRWQRATPTPSPGFTLGGFTLLCALLSLTEGRDGVTLTYNQLFRALTGSRSFCSAHHREDLKNTLATLEALDLRATALPGEASPSGAGPVYQRLISLTTTTTAPVFGQRTPAFMVHFAPHFLAALNDPRVTAQLHFGALRSLRSRITRSLYLPLSTWAHYNRASAAHPFRITLSRLIAHLGHTPPRFLSQRRAFFAGHRKDHLLLSLHNLPTPHGFLQVCLTPASSVTDDCLNIWHSDAPSEVVERGVAPPTPHLGTTVPKNPIIISTPISGFKRDKSLLQVQDSVLPGPGQRPASSPSSPADPLASFRHLKIYQAWTTSGRSDADFVARVRVPSVTLTQDDLALLHAARVSHARCQNFLLMSKKLLPQRTWLDLLGEAKYAALSHTPPTNPTGKLINEILTSVRAAV